MVGYHIATIPVGEYGEFSKIREEFLELEDAANQTNKIMVMCECADLVGAILGFVDEKYGLTEHDLMKMVAATRRAFMDGSRKPKK